MSVGKRTKSAGDLIILSPLYVYIYILFLNLNTRSFFRCVYVTDSRVSSVSDETQQSCDLLLAGSSLRRWSAARSHHSVCGCPICGLWPEMFSNSHYLLIFYAKLHMRLCYKRQILSLSSGHAPFIHVLKSTYVACRPDAFTGLLLISRMPIIGFNPSEVFIYLYLFNVFVVSIC